MHLLRQPIQYTVPRGLALVSFVLSIPKRNVNAMVTIHIRTLQGQTLAQRIVRIPDVSSFDVQRRYGMVVLSPNQRPVNLYAFGQEGVVFYRGRVDKTIIPASVMAPLFGASNGPQQWYAPRSPVMRIKVWIDSQASRHRDSTSTPLYYRMQEAMWNFGRVCGLGFIQLPDRDKAYYRFHSLPNNQVERYCIEFGNSMKWFGTNQYGSGYIAIHPNRRDIYIGQTDKYWKPLSPINIQRFVQNVLCQLLIGTPYHSDNAPIWAADNANFSGPILYPKNDTGTNAGGLAGFDAYNIRLLQNKYMKPWLGKYD